MSAHLKALFIGQVSPVYELFTMLSQILITFREVSTSEEASVGGERRGVDRCQDEVSALRVRVSLSIYYI